MSQVVPIQPTPGDPNPAQNPLYPRDAGLVAGRKSVHLDGSTWLRCDSIRCVDSPLLAWSGWFRFDPNASDLTIWVSDPVNSRFSYAYWNGPSPAAAGRANFIEAAIGNTAAWYPTWADLTDPVADAEWVHAVYAVNGATGECALYVNRAKMPITHVDPNGGANHGNARPQATSMNGLSLFVGSDGAGRTFVGDVADLWVGVGVDLLDGHGNIPENLLRRFVTTEITPTDPAQFPPGVVVLTGGPDEFGFNRGTGGVMFMTGQLTPGVSLPADQSGIAPRVLSASLARAQSPGDLVCKVDQHPALEVPDFRHGHPYDEFMAYRHFNVIGDQDPWMYWWTSDQWADIAPPILPPPPPPPPPSGWNARARVNSQGITQAKGLTSGMTGYTIAVMIYPGAVLHGLTNGVPAAVATRVTLSGWFTFIDAFVGPVITPWVTDRMMRLTFGGQPTGAVVPNRDLPYGEIVSDPMQFTFDASHGIMFSAFITSIGNPGWYAPEPGWACRWTPPMYGNRSADLDKSGIGGAPWGLVGEQSGESLILMSVEGYYQP